MNVDFEVEANGTDDTALETLNNATNGLKDNLSGGSLSLTIGNVTLEAPPQVVIVATVDVTPPVIRTFNYRFRVMMGAVYIAYVPRKSGGFFFDHAILRF